jgi:hypothetical protein
MTVAPEPPGPARRWPVDCIAARRRRQSCPPAASLEHETCITQQGPRRRTSWASCNSGVADPGWGPFRRSLTVGSASNRAGVAVGCEAFRSPPTSSPRPDSGPMARRIVAEAPPIDNESVAGRGLAAGCCRRRRGGRTACRRGRRSAAAAVVARGGQRDGGREQPDHGDPTNPILHVQLTSTSGYGTASSGGSRGAIMLDR